MPKLPPSVSAHIHSDEHVDVARADAFVAADAETRLQVLAQLRGRVADDSTSHELAVIALTFSIIGVLIAPAASDLGGLDALARLVVGALFGIIAMLMVLPFAIPAIVRSQRRRAATIWLSAYEDALAVARQQQNVPITRRLLTRLFPRL